MTCHHKILLENLGFLKIYSFISIFGYQSICIIKHVLPKYSCTPYQTIIDLF
jgi:hypothetical protein